MSTGHQLSSNSGHRQPPANSNMENSRSMQAQEFYPTRPQAKNCLFFVITGTCRYGQFCRFNHPNPDQMDNNPIPPTADHEGEMNQDVYSNFTRNIPCKFFSAGICKYGPYCRFYHPAPGEILPVQYVNSDGLPMRSGATVCNFYMKAGWCGYGATCKFHHPELIGTKDYYAAGYACAEAKYPYAAGGYTNWY